MDDDQEVTREQMDETRASLTEKLETLENQVVHSVQDTTSAIHETVADVKEAVHETVGNVKDMLDLPLQTRRHPWLIVGGSIALGYLGGRLLLGNGTERPAEKRRQPFASASVPRANGKYNGVVKNHRLENAAPTEDAQDPAKPDLLSGITTRFGPEIAKLESMVIGTLLSTVRDMVSQAAPSQMKAELESVIDSFTVKLGGEPIPGPVFKDGFFAKDEQQERNPAGALAES